jgi:hypothetical protein
MARWRLLLGFVAAFIMCFCPGRAVALEVVEAYRSVLGNPRWVSVNPTDGSCWLAAGSGIFHIAADGTILRYNEVFTEPHAVAANPADGSCWVLEGSECVDASPTFDGALVRLDESGTEVLRRPISLADWGWHSGELADNPTDGSCWVTDSGNGEVVHLAQDGTELWRGTGLSAEAVAVNRTDGSCWLGVRTPHAEGEVVHLAEDGTELWRGTGFDHVASVCVDPMDGSCWVADYDGYSGIGQVVQLAEDGTELLRAPGFSEPLSVCVNPTDGSCWVADTGHDQVVHLAKDGTELRRVDGFVSPPSISVNPVDGSCWVADSSRVVHLSEEGVVSWQIEGLGWPLYLSVNPGDGSCWVDNELSGWRGQLVHVAEDGAELWRGDIGIKITSLSVDASDGSCWVGEVTFPPASYPDPEYEGSLRHLAEDGTELWRSTEYNLPGSLSVNPTDGSCWVSGYYAGSRGMAHLARDGSELWRTTEFRGGLSVNSADGSCWVGSADIIHLAEDGTVLWREGAPTGATSVSANSTDNSCWVIHCNGYGVGGDDTAAIAHLAEDGTELWRGDTGMRCAAHEVNSADGFCWVVGPCDGCVVLLAEDGSELWRGENFVHPWCVSVNPTDGSCWVADFGTSQIVHLVIRPFRDVPGDFWACDEIGACADAGIVSGYEDGTYNPPGAVDRAQMAVYIARALAGGDENISEAGWPHSFLDVPRDHWAFDHVECCVDTRVVAGYGTRFYHPEYEVTRDQMAVYVARAVVAPAGEAGLADYIPADPRNFPDVPTDHWAYTHVEYCVEHGVVAGYLDGLYHPEIVVTRDQMAVYVARAFGLVS